MPRECQVCMEEKEAEFFIKLKCGHEYCDDCLRDYLTNKINGNELPLVVCLPLFLCDRLRLII